MSVPLEKIAPTASLRPPGEPPHPHSIRRYASTWRCFCTPPSLNQVCHGQAEIWVVDFNRLRRISRALLDLIHLYRSTSPLYIFYTNIPFGNMQVYHYLYSPWHIGDISIQQKSLFAERFSRDAHPLCAICIKRLSSLLSAPRSRPAFTLVCFFLFPTCAYLSGKCAAHFQHSC